MSESEDQLAQDALELRDPMETTPAAGEEELTREYTELAGLLALQVDDAEPRPEVKAALFERIRTERAVAEAPNVVPFATPAPQPSAPQWTTWAAAAGLVLALGFAALSGYLFSSLQAQGETVARLEQEVIGLQQARDLAGPAAADSDALARRVDLVTSTSAEVCALKPAGDTPSQPQARALFWADRESQRWVLSASRLERCPLGREYRIWFIGPDGTASGGAFRVKGPEQRIEIQADELPPGTQKVLVTLEFPERVGDEPGGELILQGDEARQIL